VQVLRQGQVGEAAQRFEDLSSDEQALVAVGQAQVLRAESCKVLQPAHHRAVEIGLVRECAI
jgi:hypothetical protein